MAIWESWMWNCGNIQWASHLCFCWNNVCIHNWKVMGNINCSSCNFYVLTIFDVFSLIYTYIFQPLLRYIVICHPLKTWLHFGKVRTIAVIIWIWVISIVFSVAWTNFASVSNISYHKLTIFVPSIFKCFDLLQI